MFLHILCLVQTSPAMLADKDIIVAEILKKWVPSFDLDKSNTMHLWEKKYLFWIRLLNLGTLGLKLSKGSMFLTCLRWSIILGFQLPASQIICTISRFGCLYMESSSFLLISFLSIFTKFGQCTWVVLYLQSAWALFQHNLAF